MRLDKFLKLTRIIKRRSIAQQICDAGNVTIDDNEKKSSYSVKKGDILNVKYFNNNFKIEVLDIPPETIKKEDIEKYIKYIV